MKQVHVLCLNALLLLGSCTSAESLIPYVDPSIGTAHSRWFFFTPAAVPFSMAKPAPTTDGHLGNPGGWQAVGYDERHTSIEGFAMFHEFQIGGVVLAPTVGALQTVPGSLDACDEGYRSRFDKEDETARPGYYSVKLKDYNILAEWTATQRVALGRFTFPSVADAHLIFNIGTRMGESGPVEDASVTVQPDGFVSGWVRTYPVYVNNYQKGSSVTLYFYAQLDQKPISYGTFCKKEQFDGVSTQTGDGTGAYLNFDATKDNTVEVKVGLSYTSVENAQLNLQQEAAKMSFDKAAKAAQKQWEEALGRIRVEGGLKQDRIKFYTGLYHALLGRGLASDVNGAYPRNDGSVGWIEKGKDGKPIHSHYNTDAIWGAFWNLTQLWTLAYPEYYADWVSSQLLVYKDAGWLGDGIACSKYVSGVGTNFVGLAIAAAYNCGIHQFDVATAYEAALKNELCFTDRPAGAGKLDVKQFVERGYSPYRTDLNTHTSPLGSIYSASHTLEYAFSAYAVAQMARSLGHQEDAERLDTLAHSWERLYNAQEKLMHPLNDAGDFLPDFDPYAPWIGFQEGNAVQYTYYVPHHIEQLVEKIGAEEFSTRLDSTFLLSRANVFGGGTKLDAFSGLHTYYNHGNQPNLHISGLFNFSGKPWLSQKWMRTICNEFYGTDGIHGYGYGQDEDQGQLGAWYVMASMGLFDVKGLTSENPSFQVVSPLFDKVTIRLHPQFAKGRRFVLETSGNAPENQYIQSLELNGEPRQSIQLPLSEIMRGGTLRLVLAPTPNEDITK